MRNLKRTLSLVLAMALVVGMMMVGASAASSDFADSSEITYTEAVDVMTAIGVMEGTDTGAFNPSGTLTREQAAAIICRMLLGDSADDLNTNSTVFTDVAADRWSAGYIGYCAQQGILAGTGTGAFNPEGELTGLAFAKMLLVALGYDATIEEYVGDDWAINVAADAIEAGVSINGQVMANAVSREQAAQMAFNTLTATLVRYTNKGTTVIGSDGMQVIVGASAPEKVGFTSTDGNNGYKDVDNDDYTQFCERYFSDLKKETTEKDSDFGRPGYTWIYDGEDVCFASEKPVLTYVTDFDDDELKDLKSDGYTFKEDMKIYVNGVPDVEGLTSVETLASREYTGTLIEMFATGEKSKEITSIVLHQGYVAQVSDLDDESITLDIYNPWAGGKDATPVTYDDDTKKDDDWYDKLSARYEQDDYLIVYTKGAVADEELIDVADVETVSGKVSTTKITEKDGYNGTFTMDGTTYTLASAYNEVVIKAGDEYDFFLDENGYVIGGKAASDTVELGDYLFVKETGTSAFDQIAKVMFMDGTSATITVSELNTKDDFKWADKNADANKFYTFKEKNGEYELTAVSDKDTDDIYQSKVDTATVSNDATPIAGDKADKLPANSTTLFIAKDSVYTGVKNAPEVKTSGAVYYMVKDGSLMVVYSVNSGTSSTSADELVYILSEKYATGVDDNDEEYREYDVFMDGEKTTLKTREEDWTVGLAQISSYEDGEYAELQDEIDEGLVITKKDVTKVSYANGTLTLGEDSYLLADDVKIYTVDSTTVKSINAGSIENRVTKDEFKNLTLVKLDSDDNEISIIYLAK